MDNFVREARWQRVVGCTAMIVVFGLVAALAVALTLVAITRG